MATKTGLQYVTSVDEDSFDPTRLSLYWRFVAERQNMYVRRVVLGLPAPWTEDPILQSEFITNCYRELDPGTMYVTEEILEYEKPIDRVFNVMMYRLMGSQRTTHELITSTVKGYKAQEMIDTLREHARDVDNKVFGDAYRVAAYQEFGGDDKIENVALMFEKFAKQMPEIMRRLAAATSPNDAYDVFKGLQGMGEFLAHQITVDLLYGDEPVLPFGDDTWAKAGPGARNGIWSLIKPGIKPSNLLMVMTWLRDNQAEQFEKNGLVFPYVMDLEHSAVPLSLCNIQSTLCEYFKYVRIWSGETKGTVRPYRPSDVVPNGPGVVLNEEQIDDVRTLHPALTAAVDAQQAEMDDLEVVVLPETLLEERRLDQIVNGQSFEFTAPDGRSVSIVININL